MIGKKTYHYIVDGLTADKAVEIKRNLRVIPDIIKSQIEPGRGTVSVVARRNVEDSVKLACEAAGCTFRTRLRGN